ncbi:vesicular glutamate transporter 1-like [Saccoglossus kowalevskii]|uniref:Vesicular glutamate transporter 1-like n=1 Tax=Saccoglossus kowalevskii TaxID=10224 RepID=A0ABM0M1L8_SACKO|nr:PREDICTED: vesicular glutamate transporter 1-like [Saccoglossus kowalevskii]
MEKESSKSASTPMSEIFNERTSIRSTYSYEFNDRKSVMAVESCFQKVPKRHILVFLAFLGFCNVYALRVNLSVAIVAMTNNKTMIKGNETVIEPADFVWDSKVRGIVLGSFFYGYIVTQIPGGWFANKFGGKIIFGGGILGTALLTLLTPIATMWSVYFLVGIRVLQGLFEGVTYPAIQSIWSRWAPPMERSKLATFAFAGSYVGTFLSMPVCGLLAREVGWPSIFYVFGGIGVLWFIAWWYFVEDKPSEHPTIGHLELNYIQDTIGAIPEAQMTRPPIKSMLLSLPVWAIVAAHFSENWGFYTMLTDLPMFFKEVLGFDLFQAGVMSALPYIMMTISVIIGGQIADYLRSNGYLTTVQVRKLFNCTAFVLQVVFMVATAYTKTAVAAVTCLTIGVGFGGFAWAGFSVNPLDIAPQYASVIFGISNCIATIPGIISPSITGEIVTHGTAAEWQQVFYIAAAMYLIGAIIYGIFASGELQPWAGTPEYIVFPGEGTAPINQADTEEEEEEDDEEENKLS